MASFVNACVFTATSAGTGSFVVSAALTGWMTPATAGAVNGATYRYRAYSNDLTQWEIGTGTYTVSTTTLTRTVTASSSGGSAVNFTAAPVVALTSFAADISSGVAITGGTVTGLTSLTLASGVASPATNDAAALGTTSLMWSDLFLAAGGVINFDNGDTTITDGTNTLDFAGATSGYRFDSLITPLANDGASLGSATVSWADLFLATGGVINWANGDITITGNSNALAFAGASSGYSFDAVVLPSTNDAAALGSATVSWSDLFLAAGGVINFDNGDVTITDGTNTLAFAGAASGYSFDAVVLPSTNDAAALGSATVAWSDLFLAAGGVINFDNGDTTITEGTNTLAFAGASSGYSFDAVVLPSTNDAAALGSATVSWSDLFLASGGVINFNNGDVTVTHGSNTLTFAGAASGYTFNDGGVILGAPTGGSQGAGTVNATGVYRNGVSLGMTLLTTLTTTSGTTQPLTAIAAGYRAFYCELEGVSFTAAATLTLAATTDNTNWGTAVNVATVLTAAANVVSGVIWVYGVSESSATGKSVAPLTNMDAAATMFTTIARIQNSGGTTGVFTGIRFAGGTFDAGTIRIYGVA